MSESEMSKQAWYKRLIFLAILLVTTAVAYVTLPLFVTSATEQIKNTTGSSLLLPIYYLAAIVAFSLFFLLMARTKKISILRIIVAIILSYSAFIILLIDFSSIVFPALDLSLSIIVTGLLVYFSFKGNKIAVYVIGIVLGAGIAVILASIVSIYIAIVIMAAFAIYDSIAVNVAGSMVEIAETAIDSHLPLIFTAGKDESLVAMGFGDTVIPTFGLISVLTYFHSFIAFLIALLSVAVAFFPMLYFASKRPQPGLPYMLNALFIGIIIYMIYLVF